MEQCMPALGSPVEDAGTGFLAQPFQILDPTLLELNIDTTQV